MLSNEFVLAGTLECQIKAAEGRRRPFERGRRRFLLILE